MSGFFSVERSIFESEQFRSPQDRYAAIWIIGNVAWEDRWQKVGKTVKRVKRGQGFWSLRFLSEAWGTSLKTVRGTLEHFEKIAFLTITAGTHGTVITVCNYDYFQTPQKIRAHGGHTEIEKTPKKGTQKGTPDPVISNCEETEIQDEGTQRAHKRARAGHTVGTNYNKETNNNTEDTSPNKPDLELAVDEWNATAERSGLPKVQRLTDPRKRSLAARLKECGGIEGWRVAMAKVEASKFLQGDNDRGWTAGFDFVCQASSFTKLMEGVYDGKRGGGGPKPTRGGDALSVADEYLRGRQDPGDGSDREGRTVRDWAHVGGDFTGGESGGDQGGGGSVMCSGSRSGRGEGSYPLGDDHRESVGLERGEVVRLFGNAG